MNEDLRQKILQYIYDNHNHHTGADGVAFDYIDGKWVESNMTVTLDPCPDNDYPYVNSIELEKFIKEL